MIRYFMSKTSCFPVKINTFVFGEFQSPDGYLVTYEHFFLSVVKKRITEPESSININLRLWFST
jgi:hypothetical protein